MRPVTSEFEVNAPPVAWVKKRLVDDAVANVPFVAKKVVVVACEVVAFTPVKFWSVVDER